VAKAMEGACYGGGRMPRRQPHYYYPAMTNIVGTVV
jgi:hypothetical protein